MLKNVCLRQVSAEETGLVERFLQTMGDSARHFRYFSSRPSSVIANHLVTLLVIDAEGEPIGYGHLDPEDDKVWLGVCVAQQQRGLGLGKAIVEQLMSEAIKCGCRTVYLSVDEDNSRAISLYRQFGFVPTDKRKGTWLLRWEYRDPGHSD